MKNIFLTFLVLVLYITANAQCSIDTLITSPGIYPDSITNLDEAFVGQPYVTQIDVLTPLDTVVNLNGLTLNVTISNIDLTSVLGLPNNFSYSCNPPSCIFPGGTYACAEIFSTVDPSSSDVGYYPLIMTTSTLAINVPLIGSITQLDTVDYFYIDISNSTASLEHINKLTFELMDVFPNPTSNFANIQFVIGSSDKVNFLVFDCLGNIVENKVIDANKGVNKFSLDVSQYASALYTYCLISSNNFLSKKMLISNP
tara:strand:- start:9810 stop:10577 length:768 start_codon:yes stop_codon:yes gene_type:complete